MVDMDRESGRPVDVLTRAGYNFNCYYGGIVKVLPFCVVPNRFFEKGAFTMPERLLNLWTEDQAFKKIISGIHDSPAYRASVTGLDGSARSFFAAVLSRHAGRPVLVVAGDTGRAESIFADLSTYFPGEVKMLPPRELFVSTEILSRSEEYPWMRLRFMEWLNSGGCGIYVTTAAALLSKVLPPAMWEGLIIRLHQGKTVDRQVLINRLVETGYQRSALTETAGQFSARGDIIDIYPPAGNSPYRVDLFDNVIESIKYFDPSTQRSTEMTDEAVILPARELPLPAKVYARGRQLILKKLESAVARLTRRGEEKAAVVLKEQINRHLERLSQPDGLDMLSSYFSFFYGDGASLLDYLSSDHLVVVEEPATLIEKGNNLRHELAVYLSNVLLNAELIVNNHQQLWDEEELFQRTRCPLLFCSLFPGDNIAGGDLPAYHFDAKSAPSYHGQRDLFRNDYKRWLENGYSVYLIAGTEKRGRGLREFLADPEEPGSQHKENLPLIDPEQVTVLTGTLEEGFVVPSLKLAVIDEQNLLPKRKKKKRAVSKSGIRLSDYRELKPGDYVVHEQHGIGRYQGTSTLEIGGTMRDYLMLRYRGADRLYIPIDQVELIQKYSGGEGPPPRLHSLGGGEWQRIKSRVNRSIEELARELLSIYAARQAVEGYAFGPDHSWQEEFEANFPYEETPDQQRAIVDVKTDLEKEQPMDRLICGDVGYGKTEVAMRAAFKVVIEGKQVAVLVPTTVLAMQHYNTFRERFAGFPVKIACLSRFVAKSKQKEIIEDLSTGKIDIVIGTHRLLSADISFNDLGLFVADEEQRFGVLQKEKMKKMRLEIDALTLTATPIPRTLHLSLAGARDLSIIETPPENRFPIQTYVLEYSEELLREAVQREISRGGQVFIVYNRIDRISRFAERIQKIFPKASVAVGHGRMPEANLERVMTDFQAGLHQILISTTIIESGLDIPNVNTLIICDADKFGLAQLYQIRGRVGRSDRLAYAYLTYRRDKVVSEDARKRLKAIKEFTELGSGFKIALRDLEIRGAGNILGAEQHGFIAAVGYDLYVKLLDQAVAVLKNEKGAPKVDTRLDLPVDAYIPSAYVGAQAQKVDFYRRIYGSDSLQELLELGEELIDRFGTPPEPVNNLLKIGELRILAARLKVTSVQQKKTIQIRFTPEASVDENCFGRANTVDRQSLIKEREEPFSIRIKPDGLQGSVIDGLLALFRELIIMQEGQKEQTADSGVSNLL